jgi:glycosyltransferase involved in cell wall biosynthesis/GT2 family glycosyltransferase
LSAIDYLDHAVFEVIVVCGPTQDGTDEILHNYTGRIKIARNAERNLSISRNLGIKLARGEIVAFLDDDAIPEPDWLTEIITPYLDSTVGASGGFVYGPDGFEYQYRFGTANRFGDADLSWNRATPEFSFPFSENFPHLLGANSSFRRSALLEVGGFDEEYEYYLDETDVTLRILDKGWKIAQVAGGHVHHKFMPSHIRNNSKILKNWYPVLKNKVYFCLTHAAPRHSMPQITARCAEFIEQQRVGMEWAISEGLLGPEYREIFHDHVDRAWRDGLSAARRGAARTMATEDWSAIETEFLQYPVLAVPGGRRSYCFLSQSYPPSDVGGIGRYIHLLAREVAQMGHDVHVLTRASGHDTIDFEDGVWVHRVAPSANAVTPTDLAALPDHIALYCDRLRREVQRIHSRHTIVAVYCPTWDCEGYALMERHDFPLILSLQTTLKSFLKSNEHFSSDQEFMRTFGTPMIAAERTLFEKADGIHALSEVNATDIALDYGIRMTQDRLRVIPLGAEDWAIGSVSAVHADEDGLRLLFVGRVEPRKAIDVVLEAARDVLARHPGVTLDIVGDDTLPWNGGRPYREIFETDPETAAIRNRVTFHGKVSDADLRGFYAGCDVLVTPSRYESFGLMLVEAMMFSKVVIGARVGGMQEVIEDGVSGFLVQPDDPVDLANVLDKVLGDPTLREKIGHAARDRYEERFTPERMARSVVDFMDEIAARRNSARSHVTEGLPTE